MFIQSLFWFALCCCMAGLEIEAEGKFGWAEKMPTWYRTTGPVARLYGLLMGGKPLTGYHAFMFFLPLITVHVPFAMGTRWSVAGEFAAVAMYFVVGVLWDFLWFVFNPAYGIRRFTKRTVWWHAKSPWVFGLFPADYLYGIAVSVGCVAVASWASGDPGRLAAHGALLAWLALFTAIGIALSPSYRRWRASMAERDDRDKTDIFHD